MSKMTAIIIRFPGRAGAVGFTASDLMELYRWQPGGNRLEIGEKFDGLGQFAQVFKAGESWASWAISREDGQIRLWNSLTQADIGRFATVQEALGTLPGAEKLAECPRPTAEVVLFRRHA